MEEIHGPCGYTALFEHYGDILSAGGLQLSKPQQRYLIDVIRTQSSPDTRTASTPSSTKSNIALKKQPQIHKSHDKHCTLYAVSPKTSETKPYCGLRVTRQEEDLLWSLLESGGEQTRAKSPGGWSVQEESSAPEVSHVGIVIPYVPDEDEERDDEQKRVDEQRGEGEIHVRR